MPRKGSQKVRTGCLTCKVRKVKCDEQKPACHRCTSTGRTCQGYAEPGLAHHFLALARYPSATGLSTTQAEGRALQYFQAVVQPALVGAVDSYFWDRLVLQFGQYHGAVRHATVAISALYEQLQVEGIQALPDGNEDLRELALDHYNKAIRELVKADNEPLALVVCVLFICVDFLFGNADSASDHCRHGLLMLNRCATRYPWILDYLVPIFRRLSIVPFFFGTNINSMPALLLPPDDEAAFPCGTLVEAQHSLDQIECRAVRCVRSGDAHRMAFLAPETVTPEMHAEREAIERMFSQWQDNFFASDPPAEASVKAHLLALCTVMRVWVNMAFESDETKYVAHIDSFQQIVDLATLGSQNIRQDQTDQATGLQSKKFTFETGFLPLLYFVAIRCRHLPLRLAALSLLERPGIRRENLWNVDALSYMSRRVIEIEHGIKLTKRRPGMPTTVLQGDIAEAPEAGPILVREAQWDHDKQGKNGYRFGITERSKLRFYLQGAPEGHSVHFEWYLRAEE